MAMISSSLSTSKNVSSLLQSVVNYVKDTRATCLNLQHCLSSILYREVDVQPIFDSLIESHITEVSVSGAWRIGELRDVLQSLNGTKIDHIDLSVRIFNKDQNMSTILKKIHCQTFLEQEVVLNDGLLDELFSYLKNSRIRSLEILDITKPGLDPILVISRILSVTSIRHLRLQYDLNNRNEKYLPKSAPNLRLGLLIDLNLADACFDDSMARVMSVALVNSMLESLTLESNELTDVGVDFLVPGLIQSKISHLDLRWNEISGRNTLLQSLKNTKILTLDLAGNPFVHDVLHANRDFLKGSSVVTLSLSFKETILASRFLPAAFIRDLQFSDLTHLYLGGNILRSGDIEALAGILSRTNLTHLDVNWSEFSERCYSILGEGIRQSKVKYINLCRTDLILKPAEAILGIVSLLHRTKGSELLSVDIELLELWKEFAIIAFALRNLTLIQLRLSSFNGPLSDTAMASLAQQLKSTSITSLDLRCQKMEEGSVKMLAKHLVETQIVKLNISSCTVNSRGAKALASALKSSKLRSLDLSDNKIGEDGLECLVRGAKNTCVTHLNVSGHRYSNKMISIDRVMWDNKRKVQQFTDLLTRTATGKSCLLDFDRDFNDDQPGADSFVENCMNICKFVSEEPHIVGTIEQDVHLLKLEMRVSRKEDCELIYEKIMAQPSPLHDAAGQNKDVTFFKKQALWFILEYLPTKLAFESNRAKLLFKGFK